MFVDIMQANTKLCHEFEQSILDLCVQDARIPSQDAVYTLATLDDLCTVCNTCQFIPLRANYHTSRYHSRWNLATRQTLHFNHIRESQRNTVCRVRTLAYVCT